MKSHACDRFRPAPNLMPGERWHPMAAVDPGLRRGDVFFGATAGANLVPYSSYRRTPVPTGRSEPWPWPGRHSFADCWPEPAPTRHTGERRYPLAAVSLCLRWGDILLPTAGPNLPPPVIPANAGTHWPHEPWPAPGRHFGTHDNAPGMIGFRSSPKRPNGRSQARPGRRVTHEARSSPLRPARPAAGRMVWSAARLRERRGPHRLPAPCSA